MGVILVAGVTGNIASRVARKLAAKGVVVRGVARHPSAFEGEGVELVPADLTDASAADKILEDVDSVYLTRGRGGPTRPGDHRRHERPPCGDERSCPPPGGPHRRPRRRGDTGARILDNKHPIEKAIENSGVGFTILRPGWFLQNLFGAKGYLEQGMFAMPWPADRAWAGTSVEDVARAAVAFLDRGPANAALDVHIPGGVTGAAICEAAGAALGREVAYQEFPRPTREFVEPYPLSPVHKDLYAELFDYFRRVDYQGEPSRIAEALAGFETTSLGAFMRGELFAQS